MNPFPSITMYKDLEKHIISEFKNQIWDDVSKERLKQLFKQYVHDCKIVEEDPDLKSLKKELGINDDLNVVEMEIQINFSVNTVKIDLNIQTAEESRKDFKKTIIN